jgi:uncharacterized protein YndB with AHSA1/START domain
MTVRNNPDSGIGYELSKTFSASPEALFDALTSAVVLKRIWGVQEIDVDARVGGRAVAKYVVDGQDWSFTITYTDLDRDKGRLRWVARFKSFPAKETRVYVQLTRVSGGTELTLRMENFESTEECNANREAWKRGLAILTDVVEAT